MSFDIQVVTIFPEYLAPLGQSLLGKAAERLVTIGVHDLRQWTDDVHRTVDDAPYGGGPGMVMRPEPWGARPGRRPPGRRLVVPDPRRAAVHPGARRGVAGEPGLCSPAGATRASTSGWPTGRPTPARCPRSRSATTCWPAGSPPSSSWWRRSPGCCPASSATASPSRSTPTPTACSRARPTPAASWRGHEVRRCCCPATTPRSTGGGAGVRCAHRAGASDLLAALPDDALTDAERAALDADG